jgi:hypothetical protein
MMPPFHDENYPSCTPEALRAIFEKISNELPSPNHEEAGRAYRAVFYGAPPEFPPLEQWNICPTSCDNLLSTAIDIALEQERSEKFPLALALVEFILNGGNLGQHIRISQNMERWQKLEIIVHTLLNDKSLNENEHFASLPIIWQVINYCRTKDEQQWRSQNHTLN